MLATQSDIRHELSAQLSDARCQSDALFALVRPDSLYDRPIAERHGISKLSIGTCSTNAFLD